MKIKILPAEGIHVVVAPYKAKTMSRGGIVLAINEDRERAGAQMGTVLSIGPSAWRNELYGFKPFMGWHWNGWKPWCKVGDKIFFKRYAGLEVCINDSPDLKDSEREFVRILNDEDVQGIFEEVGE